MNQSVWRGYRLSRQVVRNIFHMMQAAGLYSYHSSFGDALHVIRRHIKRILHEEQTSLVH